jgi:hypothetical protein
MKFVNNAFKYNIYHDTSDYGHTGSRIKYCVCYRRSIKLGVVENSQKSQAKCEMYTASYIA